MRSSLGEIGRYPVMTLQSDVYPLADTTRRIIAAAMEVHTALGPGLLENTYRACLAHQLSLMGIRCETEVPVPLSFKGMNIESAYRADLIVDGAVVVELKCVEALAPIHEAQLLTYLKHSGLAVGLLVNFNVRQLRHGIRRFTRRR